MKNIQKNLMQFNLNESDVKIYLFLVKNSETDIPTLVDKINLSRTAIYNSYDILKEKNLVEQRKIGRNVYFKATHPANLKKFITEKKQQDAELERNLKANINILTNNFNLSNNKPGTIIFEGKKGIIEAYEDLLKDNLPIDSIEDKGEMQKFIPKYVVEYTKKRIKTKLPTRIIAPSVNKINDPDPKIFRHTHFVDVKKFPFEMDIKINNKKIILLTFQKKTAVGIVIIHPEIVKNYQIMFNWLWHMTS